MSTRLLVSVGALAIVVVGAVVAPKFAFGQAPTAGTNSSAAGTWTMPRTPWGDPDLQGIWDGKTMTPLERPDKFAGREFLTEEEVAALEHEATAEPGRNARSKKGTHEDIEGAYNDVFTHRATNWTRTKRSSLIVDPPDGKIPRLKAEVRRNRPTFGTHYTLDTENPVADNPEDRPSDRCLGMTLPFSSSWGFVRTVQTPGDLAIYYEHSNVGGIYRHFSLDGRPHLPSHIRQWLGHSAGRWEGDTLVIDTTNFSDQTNFHGSRENLHLVERFTRVGPDLIMYRITIDDSTTFARPWTIEVPLTKRDDKQNLIFETACHEGNYGLTGILAGARAREKEQAANPKGSKK